MIAKFVIRKTDDQEFYFTFHLSKEVVLSSRFFHSTSEAQNGIEVIKQHIANNGSCSRNMSKAGRVYFTFRSGDVESLGQSMMYDFASKMEQDLALLKKYAPEALVEDATS